MVTGTASNTIETILVSGKISENDFPRTHEENRGALWAHQRYDESKRPKVKWQRLRRRHRPARFPARPVIPYLPSQSQCPDGTDFK
ncbi:MAG: hypothetical protein WD342_02655 [Verrucomicrobiales bacterium]